MREEGVREWERRRGQFSVYTVNALSLVCRCFYVGYTTNGFMYSN